MPEIDYERAGSITGQAGALIAVYRCGECFALTVDRGGHAKWHGDNRLRVNDPEAGGLNEGEVG